MSNYVIKKNCYEILQEFDKLLDDLLNCDDPEIAVLLLIRLAKRLGLTELIMRK